MNKQTQGKMKVLHKITEEGKFWENHFSWLGKRVFGAKTEVHSKIAIRLLLKIKYDRMNNFEIAMNEMLI